MRLLMQTPLLGVHYIIKFLAVSARREVRAALNKVYATSCR